VRSNSGRVWGLRIKKKYTFSAVITVNAEYIGKASIFTIEILPKNGRMGSRVVVAHMYVLAYDSVIRQ
jgi:hypothetical protein